MLFLIFLFVVVVSVGVWWFGVWPYQNQNRSTGWWEWSWDEPVFSVTTAAIFLFLSWGLTFLVEGQRYQETGDVEWLEVTLRGPVIRQGLTYSAYVESEPGVWVLAVFDAESVGVSAQEGVPRAVGVWCRITRHERRSAWTLRRFSGSVEVTREVPWWVTVRPTPALVLPESLLKECVE